MENTYKAAKLKRTINEFREFLINRCTSRKIVNDDKLYNEYIYLLRKYEELIDRSEYEGN